VYGNKYLLRKERQIGEKSKKGKDFYMRIKFLGTGASEGIPSLFCNCPVCKFARSAGGKEMRSRSGVLLDDDLLIDFSSDIFLNVARYGIDISNIRNIIVSHSHFDHFYINDIAPQRYKIEEQDVLPLHIYSNNVVTENIQKNWRPLCEKGYVQTHVFKIGTTVSVGDYQITVFRSQHMSTEESMVYLIEKDGKKYLHLYDTGEGVDNVLLYLKERGIQIDAVAMDCTYGLIEREYFGHMNLNQNIRLMKRFKKEGVFTNDTKICATHICHWGGTYADLSQKASANGITVAFDGLELEI
jgi:phosphoribosyl 1,2-cyclic phosphate phosphodiesterase